MATSPADTAYHSVVVIGAGVAGLAAARQLLPVFPDLLVLEAAERIGGRIKQVNDFVSWPVEAGPEFVHGANSVLKDLLEEMGCTLREYAWPDYWYFGKERRMMGSAEKDAELEKLHEIMENVGEEEQPAVDISAADWLRSKGATDKMLAAAEACYANDFGCSLRQLGLREMITENRSWDSGESYLILDRSLGELAGHLAKDLGPRLRTGCPVVRIQYGGANSAGITLLCSGGQRIQVGRVVLAVPITVLQRADIVFLPPLPPRKQAAIDRIKMSTALKVMLAFSEPFWPEGFFDVVCTDCFVPEFWVTRYPATSEEGLGLHCMVGFIAGDAAVTAAAMRPSEVVRHTLEQLDRMFGTAQKARPATAAYVKAAIADWSKEPFIHGAYSYPSLGAENGDREALAAPINSLLFFAGEATHSAVNPCIQAALETGMRAAAQVISAVHPPANRL